MPAIKNLLRNLNIQTKEINRSGSCCSTWFWCLFLLLSTGICIDEIYRDASRYRSFATVISYEEEPNRALYFPRTFICPRNPLNAKALTNIGFPPGLIPFLFTVFHGDNENHINEEYLNSSESTFNSWTSKIPNFDFSKFLTNTVILSPEQIFRKCLIHGKLIPCRKLIPPLREFGYSSVCYFFMLNIVNQTLPGNRGKVSITMERDLEALAKHLPERDGSFELFLLPSNFDYDPESINPIFLSPGSSYEVRLKLRKAFHIQTKRSHCRILKKFDMSDLSRVPFEGCRRICELHHNLRKFNCSVYGTFLSFLNATGPQCPPGRMSIDAHENCKQASCKECDITSCKTISFQPVLSPAPVSVTPWNGIRLDIYYEDLKVLHLTEQMKTTFASTLGTIGGQISLWLGLRVATAVQLLFYLCVSSKHALTNKRRSIDTFTSEASMA